MILTYDCLIIIIIIWLQLWERWQAFSLAWTWWHSFVDFVHGSRIFVVRKNWFLCAVNLGFSRILILRILTDLLCLSPDLLAFSWQHSLCLKRHILRERTCQVCNEKKLCNGHQLFEAICLFFHQSKGSAFPFTTVFSDEHFILLYKSFLSIYFIAR